MTSVVEQVGVRADAAHRGVKLTACALLAIAAVALLAAASEPSRAKANAVWEWEDLRAARAALVFGSICLVSGIGIAVASWRGAVMRPGRLLAAQACLAGIVIACAFVVLRSGTWLGHARAVVIP